MRSVALRHAGQRLMSRLAMLAMLVHLVSPVGFMPAPVSAGHWLTVCPDGLPFGWLGSMHEHGHGQDDGGGRIQLGLDECPIGSASGAPSLVYGDGLIIPASNRNTIAVSSRLPARSRSEFSALARAPPKATPS